VAAVCHPTEWRQIAALLQLLLSGGFVEVCVDGNRIPEDANEALCQWEFHDLLFHVRSRLGRHDYPMGGLVPFLGRIAPQPAIKPSHRNLGQVTLFRPDLDKVARNDQPFTAILESRCSDRNHATVPVKLKTLGEFLFRVARIRSQFSMNRLVGSFTNRPYPNGGGLYEIEVYLTVNKCGGLKRGFYYYDALHHNLIVIAPPTDGMEMLLEEARSACAMTDQPNILITLASRFQRVSWKYQGIAYALMLKNIGVMQATMNLVATAMNLASCIVGVGNSDRFSKVAGTDYYKEGSTGEFILGSQVKTNKRFDSNSSK
jgi:SagB-type dehydrogenase family enzyme